MESKTKLINGKIYTYVSLDETKNFFCNRCKKNKKSKKYAEYVDQGKKIVICNGCYGLLCSKNSKK